MAARSTLGCLLLLFAAITPAAWMILTEPALVVPVGMNLGKRSKHSPVPGLCNHQLNVPRRVKPLMIAWLLFPAKRFEQTGDIVPSFRGQNPFERLTFVATEHSPIPAAGAR